LAFLRGNLDWIVFVTFVSLFEGLHHFVPVSFSVLLTSSIIGSSLEVYLLSDFFVSLAFVSSSSSSLSSSIATLMNLFFFSSTAFGDDSDGLEEDSLVDFADFADFLFFFFVFSISLSSLSFSRVRAA
jgi:hypothetical protein